MMYSDTIQLSSLSIICGLADFKSHGIILEIRKFKAFAKTNERWNSR